MLATSRMKIALCFLLVMPSILFGTSHGFAHYTIIGSLDTAGSAKSVEVVGDIAYVADGANGLQVIDVSDPANPEIIGSLDIFEDAKSIAVEGNKAYVRSYPDGLSVIDVSNPANMEIIGSLDTTNVFAVEENIVYTTSAMNFQVIDMSIPADPEIISSVFMMEVANCRDIEVVGDRAYLACGYSDVHIVDVSDPTSPQVIASIERARAASAVTVIGNLAYVAYDFEGLGVFDVSNPANILIIGLTTWQGWGYAYSVTLEGETAYVAGGEGLYVFDVSNPASPQLIGSLETQAEASDVSVVGNTAFVANADSGLTVIDVSKPSAPEINYAFERMWPSLQQPWYFFQPEDIAVHNGYIFLVDTWNNRIVKLTSSGKVVKSIGGLPSPGIGYFDGPGGITIDEDGFVYIADSGNHRIQKFTEDLKFMETWPSYGGAQPHGLAVDSQGYIYNAVPYSDGIYKYKKDGTLVLQWGSSGSGTGEFNYPIDIASDKDDFIYVTDSSNHRIQKFTSEGEYVDQWGSEGTGPGQFIQPNNITIDSEGYIYVSEQMNDRVQKFTSNGDYVTEWDTKIYGDYWDENYRIDVLEGGPVGIAVDPQGILYITTQRSVTVFNASGDYLEKWGCQGGGTTQFERPSGIAFDSEGYIYVADSSDSRIKIFDSNGVYIANWYGHPSFKMAIANDTVYLYNLSGKIMYLYTRNGEFISEWSVDEVIYGFDVDSNGNLFVATGSGIIKYDAEGAIIAENMIGYVPDVALDSINGYVYAIYNYGYSKFDLDLELLDTYGGVWGENDGQFLQPESIAIDNAGNIYIGDIQRDDIQKLSTDGEYIGTLGRPGTSPGNFRNISDISFDSTGNLYVSETGNSRVQKFKEIELSNNNKAIILAGGGDYPGNNLWDATQLNANFAYRTLTYQGFTKESIYYLTSDTDLDLDNNGEPDDVDGDATNANLQSAIENWASDAENLILYLVDHGGDGIFRMSGTETLNASELDSWLDQLQNSIPGKITVIYDACESGSFISLLTPPAEKERLLITSTSREESAYFVTQGSISFSNYFWTHIFNGETIKSAFDLASQALQMTTEYQHPLLDASGDGDANNLEDFNLVENAHIGNGTKVYADGPVIGRVFDPDSISGTIPFLLTASNVTDSDGIARVWAVIRPPGYNQGSSDNPVQELPTIDLMPVGNNNYEISYDGFNAEGIYQIVIYARDRLGNTSIPKLSTVTVDNPLKRKAIIVAGGNQADPLWPATEKTTKLVCEALTFQGYSNDDIYLMSPASIPGVTIMTVLPTLSNLEYSTTLWGSENTQDIVLYLVGNGGNGWFEMNDSEKLTATNLDSWLDSLQEEISGKVTIIYDANQSGSFLLPLTPPEYKERITITSASDSQPAYFISEGDISFSKFFWRQVLNGMNVRDSFVQAKNNMRYCQGQIPQLDDNGNGTGNEKSDGQVSRYYTLGVGIMLAGDDPVIGSVSSGVTLHGDTSQMIWTQNITTTGTIDKVWAVISPPGNPETDPPTMELVYNVSSDKYEGTYNDFSIYGTYNVAVYAIDTYGNVSQPFVTEVTQKMGPDIYEEDNTYGNASIITVNDTEAQRHTFHDQGDLDWLKFYGVAGETYEIKTENLGVKCDTVITLYESDGTSIIDTRDDNLYGEEELLSWQCPADGIYYVLVKQYDSTDFGQDTEYDLSVYHPTGAGAGIIKGRVVDFSGNGICGALVRSDIVNAAAITLPNGYYIMFLPTGTYAITVNAEGVLTQKQSGVEVTDLGAVTLNFNMYQDSGDINGDNLVDLTDLIVTLQVVTKGDVSSFVRPNYGGSGADINGDNTIGMEETIYILQKVSELR